MQSLGRQILVEFYVCDPEAASPTVSPTGYSNDFGSAGNAIVGKFHYSERYSDGVYIQRVDLETGAKVTFKKVPALGGSYNLAADTNGTLWEIDLGTDDLYRLAFNETTTPPTVWW